VNSKPILFALIFAGTGIFVLGNTFLLLFRGINPHWLAMLGFAIIIIFGLAGLAFGWIKQNRE